MNPITRIAVVAAVLVAAIGVAVAALRPASQVGPPAPSSAPPPTIEGTWDVSFTRQEMLAAGLADSGEDDPSNYGHFRLTFDSGRWAMEQTGSPGSGTHSTYTLGPGVVHLFSPADDATFDIPYTVSPTTLVFGRGGPVTFRVKAWTRVATQPIPSPAAAGPLQFGVYAGPTLRVSDIVAAVDSDASLTAADRSQIIDVLFGIRGKTTWSASIELRAGQLTQRQTVDGSTVTGSFGRYAFPDDHTLVYTEDVAGASVVSVFSITIDGTSFTLHRTTLPHDSAEDFATRILFESGPFTLRQ